MKHVAQLGLVVGTLTGCFYVEPINQRPSLDIRRDSSDSVQRGQTVRLYTKEDDPEGHTIFYSWSVRACTDAIDLSTCDDTAFDTGEQSEFTFTVPRYLADNATTVRALHVELTGVDEYGGALKFPQVETIAVVNASPLLEVEERSAYNFVVDTPVDLFAQYSDPDDDLEKVTLDWTAFSPTQATATLMDLTVPPGTDPSIANVGKTFRPNVLGEWQVRVIARDEVGPPAEKLIMFQVGPDKAPCLAQWSPIAPTAPTSYLPITETTIFQVPIVSDDLDRYPGNANPQPGDILGQATFQWSIKRPGAPGFANLGTTNQVAIDPQQFAPGDRFEVRVEIADRNETPLACAPGDQTCAVDANRPGCLQRQTWRVEAR